VAGLREKHKRYAAVRNPRPVKLKDAAIGTDEYVVLFDLLGEGIGVKLIRGKKVILSKYLKWKADQLRQQIERFRKPFETANLREFSQGAARSLYDKLLSTALQKVPKGNPIVIIPDGILSLLPFEALVVDGRAAWKTGPQGPYPEGLSFLGDRHPITYYQSITAMTLSRTMKKDEPTGGRVLVMADPVFRMRDPRAQASRKELLLAAKGTEAAVRLMDEMEQARGGLLRLRRLGETGELAGQIEKLYGESSSVYTGLLCTKERFLEQVAPVMDQFSAIVFATHGFAGNNIPGIMEPTLALTMVPPGTDGFLTVSDVVSLNMNADVAALTACQTGLGISLAGEGVMSMGRAFQAAGARSVLMSLWSVAESSSVIMMEEFFRGLKEGKGKLESWTEARAKVRNAGFEHPFYWAPFVLVGDFK
jgi:CHAT domain-containing protein